MNNKIVVYGEAWRGSMPYSIMLALNRQGYDVILFDYTHYYYHIGSNRVLGKIGYYVNKLYYGYIVNKINNDLISIVKDCRPRMVVVVKGRDILPSTLTYFNNINMPVINWHVDEYFNPYYITKYSDSNFTLYDLHLSSRPHMFDYYNKRGARRVVYQEFCYDPSISYPVHMQSSNECDVSFVGNWSNKRESVIRSLCKYVKAYVWGGGWWRALKLKNNVNCRIMDKRVDLEAYSRVIASSKICINCLTAENKDMTNLRTFEIPACGGFQMTEYTEQQYNIFNKGEGVCFYGNYEQLKDNILYYLDKPDQRRRMAEVGYSVITSNGNTYVDRCKYMIKCVGEM
jgi:spore maturation protein CgeB